MAKYQQTSLPAIRTGAKITLSLMDVDDYDYAIDYFLKEGVSALEEYGAIFYDTKRAEIYLEDGKAELPCDYMAFIGLYNANFKYWIGDIQYLNTCECTGSYIDRNGIISVSGNCLDTNSTVSGKACLVYKAYNLDKEGQRLIPKYAERALRNYAAAEFAATRNTMYSPQQVQSWRATWVAQKPHLKGLIWQDYFQEHQQKIKEWIKAIVPNQTTW